MLSLGPMRAASLIRGAFLSVWTRIARPAEEARSLTPAASPWPTTWPRGGGDHRGPAGQAGVAGRVRAGQRRERLTLKLVAATFFILAAYVTVEGVRDLVAGEDPDRSTVGLVLLALSIIVMPLLARAKRRVARQLGEDPLILADAAETRICVLLSISTLLGLGLFALTGAGWLDPVAGFVIALVAVHEGREAWGGECRST